LLPKDLSNLNFETKRAIILDVLDKVIGTQQILEVSGFLPITPNHVLLSAEYRHSGVAERG